MLCLDIGSLEPVVATYFKMTLQRPWTREADKRESKPYLVRVPKLFRYIGCPGALKCVNTIELGLKKLFPFGPTEFD